jgi:hypothetical protein
MFMSLIGDRRSQDCAAVGAAAMLVCFAGGEFLFVRLPSQGVFAAKTRWMGG